MNPGAGGRRRFRYAPTPTRELHVGNGLAALVGWAAARRAGGDFILRIEDIDRTRCKPALRDAAMRELRWLGIEWDEGPDVGGPAAPYEQSQRLAQYDDALARLEAAGRSYACRCSRADVRAAMRAPHLHEGGELPYAGTCRPQAGDPGVALLPGRGGYRLDVVSLGADAIVTVRDGWLGVTTEDVRTTCGDFLLGRPGAPTYQLAAVTDDLAMGVTDVVRGRDLAGSTARQILLCRALGAEPPRHAHHPLLVDAEGQKLSKRHRALTLAGLRASGVAPERLRARLGAAIGLWRDDLAAAAPADFIDALPELDPRDAAEEAHWHDGRWVL